MFATTLRSSIALLALTLACACNNDRDDKTSDSGGDGGGFWAVGEDATMVRLTHDGAVSQYPLEAEGDLLAIACKGHSEAVAVGEGGLAIRTDDGGMTWSPIEVPTQATLRAVALSGGTGAYIAGSQVLLRSEDQGRSFTAVPDAAGEWTAVTTTAAGRRAWVASASGEIWQLDEAGLAKVHSDGRRLTGLAATPDGAQVVAVGEAGALLRSLDGGASWAAVETPTQRDLHAVRVAGDGSVVVAVGGAGVVLRIDDAGISSEEHLDPARALRALHLSSDGHGHAVGDGGAVLATHDAGVRWEAVAVDLDVALFGLDDLHGEPHL